MAKAYRTTDYGTVVLHVLLVVSFLVLMATGLRLASDDPEVAWVAILDPILPVHDLWLKHLLAGMAFAAVLVAYMMYMRRARLGARVRMDRARTIALLRGGKARWGALNVLVYWLLVASLMTEMVTGLLLFWTPHRTLLVIHLQATYVCLLAASLHVALHAVYGGTNQLLRVLRPAPLVVAPEPPDLAEMLADELARRHAGPQDDDPATEVGSSSSPTSPTLHASPLATALGVAVLAIGLMLGGEQMTRPSLRVVEIEAGEAPRLDGDLSDPVWAKTKPVSVLTSQGGDFGGTFQSTIEIRAVHDADYAYFAFVWDDPTRSLKHQPLVKTEKGWRIAATRSDLKDELEFNEDKLAVLLTRPGLPLIGGAIHLARRPLSDKPASSTERGLHYTGGGYADIWQWRASHTGPYGHIDNCHFGGPLSATARDAQPGTQYSGGFAIDPGPSPYQVNVVATGGRYLPRRLPKDLAAMRNVMGTFASTPGTGESPGARWWITMSESEPYTAERDALLPVGTVLPGVIMADQRPMQRTDIRGVARWAAGRWTLELARRLTTGSHYDIPIKSGVQMWVAAFDHAEKRHTRHLRPFQLEVD
ncbi:MAG: ethylbenzene dehydrogenase-related protein [Hyphomicrobiaceae bacterium]